MKISEKGIEFIKKHEGCVLKAYQCQAGVWTIGYGHTANVTPGMVISQDEADNMLLSDLGWAETAVNGRNLTLNQNQYDALVSFVFNVGVPAFLKSKLKDIVMINPDDPQIRTTLLAWNKVQGKESEGLKRRRNDEADLYFGVRHGTI